MFGLKLFFIDKLGIDKIGFDKLDRQTTLSTKHEDKIGVLRQNNRK